MTNKEVREGADPEVSAVTKVRPRGKLPAEPDYQQ